MSNKYNIISNIYNHFYPRNVTYFRNDLLKKHGNGFHYNHGVYVTHNSLSHQESAFFRSEPLQLSIIIMAALFLIAGFILNWYYTAIIFVAILTVFYFADSIFNLFLIFRSFAKDPELKISDQELKRTTINWPLYTILCPLYKEANVLSQFVNAMEKLDYPKNKLQIMLLLESNDAETINAAKDMKLKSHFEIVVVPDSYPKTKPKACNFGLLQAKGEYIVIYDAEDIPDPDQLKKAVIAFKKSDTSIACIQAKLNFYNPHQNLLTRIFTAEYSTWFDLILTGLQSINAPIPLGGTSNHFPTTLLRKFRGWDPFNVTEDCDLGMRMVKMGYKTAIIDSTTWEEANSESLNWFWQRTRWIKGYIQTYFVHMRKPGSFSRKLSAPHLFTFQLVVGGKVLSMFINPFMWAVTITYFALRPIVGTFIESFFPTPVLYMAVISLVFGNFLYMYYYMVGCAKREQEGLIKYTFLVPVYWLAMSVAAWTASYKFLINPHQWSKTKHGLHLTNSANKLMTDIHPKLAEASV